MSLNLPAETFRCYRFVALLLMEFATLSYTWHIHQPCANVPPKQYFNGEKFFKGTWYLTHSYDEYPLNTCGLMTAQTISPIVHVVDCVSLPNRKEIVPWTEGFTTVPQHGKILLQMRSLIKEPLPPVFDSKNMTIIDTDYDNYAVEYSCANRSSEGYTDATYNVWSRRPNASDVHPDVEKVLAKVGLSLSKFFSTKDFNCPTVKPHLF